MKILDSTKITASAHLNLFEIAYLDRFKKQKSWQIASRAPEPKCLSGRFEAPDAVVIVAVHQKAQQLVLIKEFRVPLGGYQIGFPAGLVDTGESLQTACCRELKEETGLDVTGFVSTSPPVFSSSGMTDESVSMVWVACDGRPSNQGNTGSEEITTILVSPDQAADLCRDPGLKFDVKTWLVLCGFAGSGRLSPSPGLSFPSPAHFLECCR